MQNSHISYHGNRIGLMPETGLIIKCGEGRRHKTMMYKCYNCIFFDDCLEYCDECCEYEEKDEEADNE